MAVELGKFLARQLAVLPEGHPDRNLIQGISGIVSAYSDKSVSHTPPKLSNEVAMIENEQFRASTQLSGRALTKVQWLHYRGLISTPDDLRNIPDRALLRLRNVGGKTLAAIRERYPYTPIQEK